jgi:hypothetical protein
VGLDELRIEQARLSADGCGKGMKVSELKGRVQKATYVVDAAAVAEAMLRNPGARLLLAVTPGAGARSRATPPPRRPA